MQRVDSWGMVQSATCDVRMPRTVDELRAAFADARRRGVTVGLRGRGNSYGDASLNGGSVLLDFSAMNRILDWDAATGIIDAEPGVTIESLWKHTLEDGYWPPVSPGTMKVTLGGAAAMNVHGKNNFCAGTLGEHVLDFDFLTPTGDLMTCSREENADVFHAAIGGFGVLGSFTRIRIKLKRVHSGLLEIEPHVVRSFGHATERFEQLKATSDYLVGWHDGLCSDSQIGRGMMHRARYLAEDEDPDPTTTRAVENQSLPSRFFFVIPKSWMWMGLWFFMNRPGMKLVNAARHHWGRLHQKSGTLRKPHAGFHYMLDHVPNWKFSYRPKGLIQYQSFVPKEHAARVFHQLVASARRQGLPPFLCVTKRHRPDPFLMTHAVDGYSLALDFRVTGRNQERVWKMAYGLDEIVLDAGGRFYFAKDSVMRPESFRRAYPEAAIETFLALKQRLDPTCMLQTDLFRRVFADRL